MKRPAVMETESKIAGRRSTGRYAVRIAAFKGFNAENSHAITPPRPEDCPVFGKPAGTSPVSPAVWSIKIGFVAIFGGHRRGMLSHVGHTVIDCLNAAFVWRRA
jgi:hypothetical protein